MKLSIFRTVRFCSALAVGFITLGKWMLSTLLPDKENWIICLNALKVVFLCICKIVATLKLPKHFLAGMLMRMLRFYSSESDSPVEKKLDPVIESASLAKAHVKDVALPVEDVSSKELKTRIKKYFEGDEEALPSVLEAILRRKLAGKHEETDDELMDELEVQPRDDVDEEEFESDFDNLYSTDEEMLAILAMFLMK
ncbi:hypothetical protein GOBAR_DD10387 [Gossypium barbadense]|nr:hypothetical protein GOBAR_DD10387 [Gossypium barbadense]